MERKPADEADSFVDVPAAPPVRPLTARRLPRDVGLQRGAGLRGEPVPWHGGAAKSVDRPLAPYAHGISGGHR